MTAIKSASFESQGGHLCHALWPLQMQVRSVSPDFHIDYNLNAGIGIPNDDISILLFSLSQGSFSTLRGLTI